MKRMTFVVALLAGIPLVLGASASRSTTQAMSVPAAIHSLQTQINGLRADVATSKIEIVFRDLQRTLVLASGQTEFVAFPCQDGEVIVTGGYGSNPATVPQIVLNGPFFDGLDSGWVVDFHNPTTAPTTVDVRVTQACIKGTGRGE